MIKKIILFFIFALWCTPAAATTYYVRIDGNDGNAGTANTSGGAWLTIDYAADNVSAGDTIRVQAGTYEERVTPGVSGADGTEITFVADGVVTFCGVDLDGTDKYLKFIGFTMDTDYGACSIQNGCVSYSGTNEYIEIWNCNLTDADYSGVRSTGGGTIDNSIFIGNTAHNLGVGNDSGVGISLIGDNNLVAYNKVHTTWPDGFVMYGDNNRWLNNYIYNLLGTGHIDGFQTGTNAEGWEQNLIEATFMVGNATETDEHVAQISNVDSDGGTMTQNIFRRNVWHNLSGGTIGINQTTGGDITYTYVYNNTEVDVNEQAASNVNHMSFIHSGTDNVYLLNNLEYETWGSGVTTGLRVYCLSLDTSCDLASMTYIIDYNLGYDPDGAVTFVAPFSTQANGQSNADPDFNDYASDDFTLGGSSNATGNAGPLTTVNEANGTGTDVDLADAGFFRGDNTNLNQYDGALVVGDTITIGTDVVVITSITGNNVTFAPSITWENGDSVYFGNDTTPDIGAYPYKAGGYALSATYLESGGTVTVTPNDSSLVRMVVVFEDGVPVGVDSISPYSVSGVGDGNLNVRVYPLYPSKTLYVTAFSCQSASQSGITDSGISHGGS